MSRKRKKSQTAIFQPKGNHVYKNLILEKVVCHQSESLLAIIGIRRQPPDKSRPFLFPHHLTWVEKANSSPMPARVLDLEIAFPIRKGSRIDRHFESRRRKAFAERFEILQDIKVLLAKVLKSYRYRPNLLCLLSFQPFLLASRKKQRRKLQIVSLVYRHAARLGMAACMFEKCRLRLEKIRKEGKRRTQGTDETVRRFLVGSLKRSPEFKMSPVKDMPEVYPWFPKVEFPKNIQHC